MGFIAYDALLKLGGFFVVLGIIFILGNRRERRKYYNSILLTRRDIKECFTHEPERSWLNAWRVGGRISIVLGVLLLAAAGVLWLIME